MPLVGSLAAVGHWFRLLQWTPEPGVGWDHGKEDMWGGGRLKLRLVEESFFYWKELSRGAMSGRINMGRGVIK